MAIHTERGLWVGWRGAWMAAACLVVAGVMVCFSYLAARRLSAEPTAA